MSDQDELKRYYLEELGYLRTESVRFGRDYPEIARELELNRQAPTDPNVELMLQSFAYLAGRLRYQMDLDEAQLPNQLLTAISPHLEAPLPAAAICQLNIGKGTFKEKQVLKRASLLSVDVKRQGQTRDCRFTTMRATPLLPFNTQAEKIPLSSVPGGALNDKVAGAIRITMEVRSEFNQTISDVDLSSIEFYLHGEYRFNLYDILSQNLLEIRVSAAQNDMEPSVESEVRILPAEALGFAETKHIHGSPDQRTEVNPGLALLKEYFSFPERYLFANIEGIQSADLDGRRLDLYLLLDTPESRVTKDSFQLNCAPICNLFKSALEPIALSATKLEYQLTCDQYNHSWKEVHSIEEIYLQTIENTTLPMAPLFGESEADGGYWMPRREPSQLKSIVGTELRLKFLNNELKTDFKSGSRVIGHALCTNRDLPRFIELGAKLTLDIPGIANSAQLLTHPTAHTSSGLTGDKSKRLVAQLHSQYLPIRSGPAGLQALKSLLIEHVPERRFDGRIQINGMTDLTCKMRSHRPADAQWRGHAHGIDLKLKINREAFSDASLMLFGSVLNECLADFTAINSFIRLSIVGPDDKVIKSWPVKTGEQWLF